MIRCYWSSATCAEEVGTHKVLTGFLLFLPFFFQQVELNGRTYLKWSSAYKQRLAIWRRLSTWHFYSAAALLSIAVGRPRGFNRGFQTRWSDDRRKTHRRGRRLADIYTWRGQKNTRRRRSAEAVVVVVPDACQARTRLENTQRRGLFAAATREAGEGGFSDI